MDSGLGFRVEGFKLMPKASKDIGALVSGLALDPKP